MGPLTFEDFDFKYFLCIIGKEQRRELVGRHKHFKLARQNCLAMGQGGTDFRVEKAAGIRAQDALDRAARIKAAQVFRDGMRVQTPGGVGKVIDVNKRTGTIIVRVQGVPRPVPYVATVVTKL